MRRIAYPLLWLCFSLAASGAPSPEDLELFERSIRPLLALECYECHNSHGKSKGGLVLDYAGGLLEGGESGPAIQPGHPGQSLLLKVLRHEIKDLRMPKGGPKVGPAITRDVAEWIRRGAPDPRADPPSKEQLKQATSWDAVFASRQSWWSFQALAPMVPGKDIDAFIAARLTSEELTPSPPAAPRVLLRRLSYALTGLPPTREEIAAFLQHGDIDREIERLLASPRFGERWARHWMDWWRYAESHGSEGDPRIAHAYQYRDYLIRALNADVPYNQLLREHVAGDLLESPRFNEALGLNESAIGPAHFRMVFHGFAPTDALDELVRFTENQVDVLTKASLGLTVSCARCHNHKFDAISQADFYALYGILASTRPGMIPVDRPERRDLHKVKLAKLKRGIRKDLAAAWLETIDAIDAETWKGVAADKPGHPLFAWRHPERARILHREATEAVQAAPAPVARHGFGGALRDWYFSGTAMAPNPGASPHTKAHAPFAAAGDFIVPREGDKIIGGLLPAGLYSHLLSDKHSATFTSPRFRITSNTAAVAVRVIGGGDAKLRYVVQNYPRNGTVYPVKSIQAAAPKWERFDLTYWRGDDAHIELTTAPEGPVVRSDQARSHFGITEAVLLTEGQSLPPDRMAGGALYAAVFRDEPDPFVPHRAYQRALREAVGTWADAASSPDDAVSSQDDAVASIALLAAFVRAGLLPVTLAEVPAARDKVQAYRSLEAEIKVPTRVPGLIEATGHDAPLFVRGNHKTPGDPVPRRFLDTVDPTPFQATNSGRLELADQILAPGNPFTSRVMVNRLWHHLFGTGLFASTDNLGRLGDAPSHPELLDQLARQFVAEGWSLKAAIRHLVSSAAFQRASTPSSEARERDPDNRLLSHYSVRRLEAEAIRDTMIQLAGSNDGKMYGPGADGNSGRRSVYMKTIRNRRDPFLETFDAPEPLTTRGRRNVTNVPGQSLTLLNDPRVIELARAFGNQRAGASDTERLHHLYESALGRLPSEAERVRALAFVNGLDANEEAALQRLAVIDRELETQRRAEARMIDAAREAILAARGSAPKPAGPAPVAHWIFAEDGKDRVGSLHLELKNGATLGPEGLRVGVGGGKAYAESGPLPFHLAEKTLLATVKLDSLTQRAGGVMNVQSLDGGVFDAIVFAERDPARWMAGSDHFRRTAPFQATDETEAATQAVTLAITYAADGTITGYRNGAPYGRPTRKQKAPVSFQSGKARVVFGSRHTPAQPGRMLAGRILEAKLFDRALGPDEVASASDAGNPSVAEPELLAALSEAQRTQLTSLRASLVSLQAERAGYRGVEKRSPAKAWQDLAQAIFNLKEFLYIR